MAKSKSKKISDKHMRLALGIVVGLVVGTVGTYLLKPSHAASFVAGIGFYGSSDASNTTPHCQVLSNGVTGCWSEAGDTLYAKPIYKNSVKNPTATLNCWAITDPSIDLRALLAYPSIQATVMQNTPVLSKTFAPLVPSGSMFSVQTVGTTNEWCKWLVLDSRNNTVGYGGFILYAPGTTDTSKIFNP